MRPLTPGLPKALLPLLGEPVLVRAIARLREQGFTRLAVTMPPSLASARRLLGDGRELGVSLAWIPEPEPWAPPGRSGPAWTGWERRTSWRWSAALWPWTSRRRRASTGRGGQRPPWCSPASPPGPAGPPSSSMTAAGWRP